MSSAETRGGRTIAEALESAAEFLRAERGRSPRLDAELLLAHLMDCSRTQLYARGREPLDPSLHQAFQGLLERRRQGEPVAHLVGWKEFYGRRFAVSPQALIPRPETEFLVEAGLQLLERSGTVRSEILELCTGSGAVAVTLALEMPHAVVWASDLSESALQLARQNVLAHGVQERIHLLGGDLFEALPEPRRFDLILANPPYVGTVRGPAPEEVVVRHEPAMALFAGPDGLDILRRLVKEAPSWLVDGGSLVLEVAAGQSEGVEAMMHERGFRDTGLVCDLAGLPRVVLGRWEEH